MWGNENQLTKTELQKLNEKLQAIVEMSSDMIFEYDIAEDCMSYTSMGEGIFATEEMTEGYSTHLVESGIIESADDAARLAALLRSGEPNFSIELRRKDYNNEFRWVSLMGRTIYDAAGQPEKVYGRIHSIEEIKREEQEIREKIRKDSLTGLLNHMTAKTEMAERVKVAPEGQQSYLVICDVDKFKEINDSNGHMFGDVVLCGFAEELTTYFPDAIRGRIGGDEFLLYEENTTKESMDERLHALNRVMAERYDDEAHNIHISASMGGVLVDGTEHDFDTLFRWADSALYQVKDNGRGAHLLLDKLDDVGNQVSFDKRYLTSQRNKEDFVRKESIISNEEELILFCMELLENMPDISMALKIMGDRLGHYYDLDDLVCVEHLDGEDKKVIFQWSRAEKSDYTRRMYDKGIYDWDRFIANADEFGTISYDAKRTHDIETEKAVSVFIVLSVELKDYKGSIVFSDRKKDRDWKREKNGLLRISNHIFSRLRNIKNEERERKALDKKLNYDELTGLPVYSKFIQIAEQYVKERGCDNLYCVNSDISNFQYLNDAYGFSAGDTVLREFARKIKNEYPYLVEFSRITSDHFVGLIKAESLQEAQESYQDFTTDYMDKCNQVYDQCNLAIATGIAPFENRDAHIVTVIDNSNEARKICKEQKVVTRVTVYSDDIKFQIQNAKNIVSNMVAAYNNNEFQAYLQPKVCVKTGKVVGAEALVRWIHPDGTVSTPGQFIDVMERNGFITKVDFVILEQVMEYLQNALQNQEEVFPISVNFSRRHAEFPAFVPSVFKRLDNFEVSGELLEAEITESVFSSDLSAINKALKHLQSRDVKVSMDDFGSGYSSLNMLTKVNVDIIKLDKDFLWQIGDKENNFTVVKYLVKMLKQLGFKVLAEGVETKEQAELLKEIDCDYAQGYYYAKPMPISEFRQFVQEYNKAI